ncbi:caspase-3-like [Argonauta hians]
MENIITPIQESCANNSNAYDMKGRRIACILNLFNSEDSKQIGSSIDREIFKVTLLNMGFLEDDIHIYNDHNCDEVLKVFEDLKQIVCDLEQQKKNIACFVCVIMVHEDKLWPPGDAEESLKLNDLFEKFYCVGLKKKPKLMFVVAHTEEDKKTSTIKLDFPDEEDVLVTCIVEKTSTFIPTLSHFLTHHGSIDILDIIIARNNRAIKINEPQAIFQNYLHKALFFLPG